MSLPDYTELQEAYDKARDDEMEKYPVCSFCKDPITAEKLYIIDDDFVCEDCLKRHYQFDTDDYVRE